MKTPSVSTVRASISFPADLYESLEKLAKQKKVSLAWIVRDAAEKYVERAEKEKPGDPITVGSTQHVDNQENDGLKDS